MHNQSKLSCRAVVYCENKFGTTDGKTANGLVRFSGKYTIVGIIDSTKAGYDAGFLLDGSSNGIPIYKDFEEMMSETQSAPPDVFIYGIAPPGGMFSEQDRQLLLQAMEHGMDIVNGLHEFLTDKEEFMRKAHECDVNVFDVRRPLADLRSVACIHRAS
jgi:uncharacterized NAD-dependent epimerase/dehydratase family protein